MRFKLSFGLALGLAGCAVGPDYRAPAPAVPQTWLEAPKDSAAAESLPDWRSALRDDELTRLMTKALADNFDLRLALARVEQARAERGGARSRLMPTLDASGGAQRQNNPFPGLAPGIKYNMFELGFDAAWEVDAFGRLQRRLESAGADAEAAAEDYRQAVVVLGAELTRTYLNYRYLQREWRITRDNLELQKRSLHLTELLVSEGVAARTDAAQAHAQVEASAASLAALEADLAVDRRQLETLTAQRPGALDAELAAQADAPALPERTLLAAPACVLRQRPDVRAAERRLASATAMQGAAMAEMYPNISLSAFIGFRNTDAASMFKSSAFAYSSAASFAAPLLNFGRIQANINLADAKQNEALLSYEKTVLDALQETETALGRYAREQTRRQALANSAADMREKLRLAEMSFGEGTLSNLQVLDAKRILNGAELDLARSEAATAYHWVAVYKALGAGAGS